MVNAMPRTEISPLPLVLDHASPVPLYHQLTRQLDELITCGVLRPGDVLEGEVSLSRRLRIARPTVRRSLAQLVARGLLVRRRGAKTVVAGGESAHAESQGSLFAELAAVGLAPSTRVLEFGTGIVDEPAASALRLDERAPLTSVHRLRLARGAPLALMRNWLPPQFRLSVQLLEARGLYELLRAQGARPEFIERSIGSRLATWDEQRLLELAPGSSVLAVTQIAFDAQGCPIETGEHVYRADRYRFEFSFKPSLPAA